MLKGMIREAPCVRSLVRGRLGECLRGLASGPIASAVLPAVRELDDDRARSYGDIVYRSLNEAARKALDAMMKGYEYQSDLAKKYVAQGIEQGVAQGEAKALLALLRARGFAVSEAARERILAQKDPERLERWVQKAAVATSLDEILDEPS